MDLVDYDAGGLRRDPSRSSRTSPRSSTSTTSRSSRSRRSNGDNVVDRSDNMPWYDGPTLLHHLENVYIGADRNLVDARFPVQWVIRPQSDEHHDYRGYAGQVAGGVFKPGDEVVVLPSGFTSTDRRRSTPSTGPIDEAFPPMSVTLRLEDEIDISPRRHDRAGPTTRPSRARTSRRWSAGCPNEPLRRAAEARDQAHHHGGEGDGQGPAVPRRHQHAAPRSRTPRSSGSTRSAASSCAPPCRCSSTPTRRTAPPASFILIDEATNVTVGAGSGSQLGFLSCRRAKVETTVGWPRPSLISDLRRASR